jgi:hypothetical protein
MQPAGHDVTWNEFRTTFRAHHIPEGLIEQKLNEFLNLTQGTRTVMQYAQAFNHLCQYAGHHADIDARKRDRFHRGLNTKLKERLNLVRADNFGLHGHHPRGLQLSPHSRKEAEDTHWTLNGATVKVSVGPEHRYPSTASKQLAWQMGSQTTTVGSIQSTTDTPTSAATATGSATELSASQPRKQQLSLFQLRQPVPLHQGMPST